MTDDTRTLVERLRAGPTTDSCQTSDDYTEAAAALTAHAAEIAQWRTAHESLLKRYDRALDDGKAISDDLHRAEIARLTQREADLEGALRMVAACRVFPDPAVNHVTMTCMITIARKALEGPE